MVEGAVMMKVGGCTEGVDLATEIEWLLKLKLMRTSIFQFHIASFFAPNGSRGSCLFLFPS